MKEMIFNLFTNHGGEIMSAIITVFLSFMAWLGAQAKIIYNKFVNDKTKKLVVNSAVKYVEQKYQSLKGEEKLKIAKKNIIELLNEKGIKITDLELSVLIESACNSFKTGFESEE